MEEVGNGVTRIRMTSLGAHLLGIEVNSYLVGKILIDTGFPHIQGPLLAALEDRDIRVICCTHSHEDHAGNCVALAAAHDCPVYLRHADAMWEEGEFPLKPYRWIWWGVPEAFQPEEMPEVASLRRVAALKPRRMLTGHGLIVDNPGSRLELKADRIEEAARRSVELTAEGLPPRQVVRRVFANGAAKDRFFEWMTSHEFSRLNFVLAAVGHYPEGLEA